MKKNFFIKLNAFKIGVHSGELNNGAPLMPLTLNGTVEDNFNSTEVFGREIATVLTSKGVYRETLFSVVIPYRQSGIVFL